MKTRFFSVVFLLLVPFFASSQSAFIQDELDAYINRYMGEFDIPGLALVIVRDGKVHKMQGYGKTAKVNGAPVDENTLFMIASNTKLFTGMALAQLEVEGKLKLDDPVKKYLPSFVLYDKNASALVSVRDLLCHRLGTKTFQGDFTFWDSKLPRMEVVKKMRLLEPSRPFRASYGYCNSGYVAAALVQEKITGTSWENYISKHYLAPLGMSRTYMHSKDIEQQPNHAKPHTNSFGPLVEAPYDDIQALGPAGSMVSCVADLSKWLLFQLDSGRWMGNQIVPWKVLSMTRTGQTLMSTQRTEDGLHHFTTYGLGTISRDYDGKQVYWHTGGAVGYVTNVCFVPEEKLGIAILTNNDNQPFFEDLRKMILDAYLQVTFKDRAQQSLKAYKEEQKKTLETLAGYRASVLEQKSTPAILKTLVGMWTHPLYGNMQIVAGENNTYKATFEQHSFLEGTLEFAGENSLLLTYNHPGYGTHRITYDATAESVKTIHIKVNDFIEYDTYAFTKKVVVKKATASKSKTKKS